MATKKKTRRKADPDKQLRKELDALKRTVKQLKKELSKKARRTETIVVGGLEVVDANGRVVASIDGNGHLYCHNAWISTGTNKRGVFLDGRNGGKMNASSLDLIAGNGNAPGMQARSDGNGGSIKLRSVRTKQGLDLLSRGAALIAYDEKQGTGTVSLRCNGVEGGVLELSAPKGANKSRTSVRGANRSGSGTVHVYDKAGKVAGRLP